MQKLLSFFRPLFTLNYTNPYRIITISVLLAAIGAHFAMKLSIDTDIANLVPETYESVKALRSLEKQVGGETPLEVAIQSPSFEMNKKMAHAVIDSAMKLRDTKGDRPFFSHAEFKKETDVLKDNALYLATEQEIEEIKTFLEDEIKAAKLEANPFFVDLDEEENEDSTDTEKFEEIYESIIPSEYPMSEDSTVMVVKLYPTGSKSNLQYLRNMFNEMDKLIERLNVSLYHPEMQVNYGGRLKRHLSEFSSIMSDVFNSFSTGIGSVILLVMIYFLLKTYWNSRGAARKKGLLQQFIRVPIHIFVIGLPLIIGLFITFGITYWVYGRLNTMTSVLFVVLFGLGIDYGIHFYARYIELRSEIPDSILALKKTYQQMAPAIFTSAITTASALYILVFADFRGFSEFGFIAGTGIMLALMAMLFVMPAFITVFDRLNWITLHLGSKVKKATNSNSIQWRFPFAKTVVVIGFLAAATVILFSGNINFQYKFSDLEPEFPEYDAFREITNQTSGNTKNNPAYILADTNQEIEKILAHLRKKIETDTLSPTIESVEAIQERYPVDTTDAREKLNKISEIRELLQDPFLKDQEDLKLDKLRRASQTTEPLSIDEIPDYLTRRFMTKQGEVGKFVIVYPSVGLADGRNSIAFKKDVGEITLENGKTFYAASTSLIAAEMLMLMQKESPYMVGATFILIFIFMMFSFRSLKWAVIAMIPLVIGLLWMFGVMLMIGLMLNFYNLVVLPAVLGIGEDNGVHMTHRYHVEGKGGLRRVLASTGQHITIGSLTTILGFWGLIFTNHPGLQTIGLLAIVGIGMTLLSGLTLHPALLQWLEDKNLV